jgi:acyl carrier protein
MYLSLHLYGVIKEDINMTNKELEEKIIRTIADATLRPISTIHRTAHLEADLGLDSISLASLTAKFEEVISLHPEVSQLTQALLASTTVGEFIDLICESIKEITPHA